MTQTATALITLLIVLWIVREIILGILARRDSRKARHERNMERTRRQFAEARNALMRAAINREVDFNSRSFEYFYHLTTAFMRRPEQYREICALIVHTLLNPQESEISKELKAESKTWSPAFRRVVRDTADAMGYVLLDYSWIVRFAFRVEKRLNKSSSPLLMIKRWAEKAVEKEKPIADIRHTQDVMYRMAGAAA